MRAIIPVAGVGTRLRPHTHSLPKVLLSVAGKPILGHILDKLLAEGITSATIVVGYMGDLVETYVRENYDFDVEFVQQPVREGLGHSIYLAKDALGDDPVLIILGDTIFEVDLRPVLASETSALGVKSVEDPRRFGVVEMHGETVSHLVEKPEVPPTNLAIVGLYFIKHPRLLVECLEQLVAEDRRTRGEYQLTDALQMMIDRGERFTTFPVEGWFDCGKPETMLETNQHLLARRTDVPAIAGVTVIPPVSIAPTATISGSTIGPNVAIGDGAAISDSTISDAIIDDGATIERSVLTGSIVGARARIVGAVGRMNVGADSEILSGQP
ncbi:MAG TPA: sugar phosphate nucleotidyltransferase [Candidatus Kapabacteria bacterium]|nr:sugar phosphate nucleotidyltransferase [Candidatus Kapabacteria bacterium]